MPASQTAATLWQQTDQTWPWPCGLPPTAPHSAWLTLLLLSSLSHLVSLRTEPFLSLHSSFSQLWGLYLLQSLGSPAHQLEACTVDPSCPCTVCFPQSLSLSSPDLTDPISPKKLVCCEFNPFQATSSITQTSLAMEPSEPDLSTLRSPSPSS